MLSSKTLKDIVSEARPIIERQLDDAERIAGFREVVASAGGDWGALKALIKAQIQDERDETSDGKRVKKILDKAEFATGYADMLGWSKMNENNFSADEEFDPITGEFLDDESPRKAAEAVSERTALQVEDDTSAEATIEGQPSVTVATSAESAGEAASVGLPTRSDGGLNIVHRHTEIATASQGEAEAPTGSTSGPTEGGDHEVADTQSFAAQAGASVQVAPAAIVLRPNCRNQDNCGGYGRNHCGSCQKAMRELEAAE